MKHLSLALIKIYQLAVSPLLGNVCRFYPSCSHYSHEAIAQHGFIKGSYFAIKRLLRCGPWSKGGYDPVPQVKKED